MKITSFTIRRSDVTKENIQNSNFPYDSAVNNNTSSTSEEITAAAAAVLLDLYQTGQKEKPNV